MHVLVAGCGWLGVALGRSLAARGERVTGVRRSEGAADALRAAGIEPLAADLADPAALRSLPSDLEAIVACQSAALDSEAAYREAYVHVTRRLLDVARAVAVRAFVYVGSTGVFGQRDGGIVDERTPAAPAGPTAEVLVEAERLVLGAASSGVPARIVRLSGLYGPGRAGVIDRVRRGVLALGPGEGAWMNFCHLDDAVAALGAVLDHGCDGAVYHGTDASPARRGDVVRWIAGRLGVEPPRRLDERGAQGTRRGADRRISGEWTRAQLGISLTYPSYREGLAPLFGEGER